MDINKAVKEYENFLANYNSGEMFKIRETMKHLSHALSITFQNMKDTLSVEESNNINKKMNDMNNNYNINKEAYTKLIDSYFPYTKANIPKMMSLLHDDQFNNFDPNVYRDVLETYNNLTSGKTSFETTMSKVNSIVKKSVS